MPELPEVETVRRGLDSLLRGRIVMKTTVHNSPKSFPNSPEAVAQFLYGATVQRVRRRAKVLMIDLDTNYSLVIHLKMTGQLVFRGETDFGAGHPNDSLIGDLPDTSTRVTVTFTDKTKLFFNDQRKFGWMKLVPTPEIEQMTFMQKVGPEPLDKRTTAANFIERVRRHNKMMIKPAILDQTVIAGVGNIYADESLWMTRLHPEARVGEIDDNMLARLFENIRAVLALSIEKGGSTDKNYVDAEGRRGNYLSFAHVFRREGQPCTRHAQQEIIKLKVAGRGTHICPLCQMRDAK